LAKKPVGQNWQGVFLRLLDDARPKAQEEHSVAPFDLENVPGLKKNNKNQVQCSILKVLKVLKQNVPGKQGKQSAN